MDLKFILGVLNSKESILYKDKEINRYEFASTCKLWAYNNDEIINSYYRDNQWYSRLAWNINRDINGSDLLFPAEDEPDAIFKAVEYLLEIKKDCND